MSGGFKPNSPIGRPDLMPSSPKDFGVFTCVCVCVLEYLYQPFTDLVTFPFQGIAIK